MQYKPYSFTFYYKVRGYRPRARDHESNNFKHTIFSEIQSLSKDEVNVIASFAPGGIDVDVPEDFFANIDENKLKFLNQIIYHDGNYYISDNVTECFLTSVALDGGRVSLRFQAYRNKPKELFTAVSKHILCGHGDGHVDMSDHNTIGSVFNTKRDIVSSLADVKDDYEAFFNNSIIKVDETLFFKIPEPKLLLSYNGSNENLLKSGLNHKINRIFIDIPRVTYTSSKSILKNAVTDDIILSDDKIMLGLGNYEIVNNLNPSQYRLSINQQYFSQTVNINGIDKYIKKIICHIDDKMYLWTDDKLKDWIKLRNLANNKLDNFSALSGDEKNYAVLEILYEMKKYYSNHQLQYEYELDVPSHSNRDNTPIHLDELISSFEMQDMSLDSIMKI